MHDWLDAWPVHKIPKALMHQPILASRHMHHLWRRIVDPRERLKVHTHVTSQYLPEAGELDTHQ